MTLINNCVSPLKEQSNNSAFSQEEQSENTPSSKEQSENSPCIDCNKTDENGRKQGLWIEGDETSHIEMHYKDGIISGVFKHFLAGKLFSLGEFTDGHYSGIWYYYDDDGGIESSCENFAPNHDTIHQKWAEKCVPDYKCYLKLYYSNGNIKEEGWIVWNESPLSDFSLQHGIWKYYDETGNLIRTEEFR